MNTNISQLHRGGKERLKKLKMAVQQTFSSSQDQRGGDAAATAIFDRLMDPALLNIKIHY